MNKPKDGSRYDAITLHCGEGKNHRISIAWIESLQKFAFQCLICEELYPGVKVHDANGNTRICELREVKNDTTGS